MRWRDDIHLALGLGLVLGVACACGDTKKAPADAQPTVADASMIVTRPGPRDHEATTEGLAAQLTELIATQQPINDDAFQAHADALALPKASEWFRDRFGAKRARRFTQAYQPIGDNIRQVGKLIVKLHREGLTQLKVARYQKVDDLGAVVYQTKLLKAMKISDPLYSVRLEDEAGSKVFHLWSFVHAKGRFRYIGKMTAISKARKVGDYDLNEFRATDADRLRELAR